MTTIVSTCVHIDPNETVKTFVRSHDDGRRYLVLSIGQASIFLSEPDQLRVIAQLLVYAADDITTASPAPDRCRHCRNTINLREILEGDDIDDGGGAFQALIPNVLYQVGEVHWLDNTRTMIDWCHNDDAPDHRHEPEEAR